ncbi:condensation domain-containing protein, partial [Bordetella tumulicola]
ETLALSLDADLHRKLLDLAQHSKASLFMVLQAGVSALLTRLGAGTDIPLGSSIAGRTDDALDELVGFFVNTLVLRADTSGNPSFRELVARVREVDLEAYAHQDLPFERLVEILNPQRSMARHPLFQVSLALHNHNKSAFDLPDLSVAFEETTLKVARFDLLLSFLEKRDADGTAQGLSGMIEYASDLFDQQTVERIAAQLTRLLTAVADNAEQPIGSIDL